MEMYSQIRDLLQNSSGINRDERAPSPSGSAASEVSELSQQQFSLVDLEDP